YPRRSRELRHELPPAPRRPAVYRTARQAGNKRLQLLPRRRTGQGAVAETTRDLTERDRVLAAVRGHGDEPPSAPPHDGQEPLVAVDLQPQERRRRRLEHRLEVGAVGFDLLDVELQLAGRLPDRRSRRGGPHRLGDAERQA